jgi:predicted aldo/keto reductase-like oxidoreductase
MSSILNYNPQMEYRRLGKTGLMVSAVSLGGHWKRVGTVIGGGFSGGGSSAADLQSIHNPAFLQNRSDVVSACIEHGINYVDACAPAEVLAYAKVLHGRRDRMYLGYSWHVRESRYSEWRTSGRLLQGLDHGLREAKLEYVDLWRISLPMDQITARDEVLMIQDGAMEALEVAKKSGKARFTGISSHNRLWLRELINDYPRQVEVVLFPYTAGTQQSPDNSLFDTIRNRDAGVFGIKPFGENSLFQGDGSPEHPFAAEDDRLARLAIRHILSCTAITAAIPGVIHPWQVQNVALALQEQRPLDPEESAELQRACQQMWTRLSPTQAWLRNWEFV